MVGSSDQARGRPEGTPPTLGRPRNAQTDEAILRAARELLVSVGYHRLSLEAVARGAGVTRPTIYRRWSSKAHLVHEAAFPFQENPLVPDSGSFAADLRAFIKQTHDFYCRPVVLAATPGLLMEFGKDPQLRAQLRQRLGARARSQLASMVDRAVQAGEVRLGTDADVLFDAIVGAVLLRLLVSPSESPDFVEHVGDIVLAGVLTGSPDPAAAGSPQAVRSDPD